MFAEGYHRSLNYKNNNPMRFRCETSEEKV